VVDYYLPWVSTVNTSQITVAMLNNALICLDDHNDGIESYVERFPESNNKE